MKMFYILVCLLCVDGESNGNRDDSDFNMFILNYILKSINFCKIMNVYLL